MKSIRLLGLLSVRAFPWVRKFYLLNQHFEQRVADKVLIGQQHDLAGGAGDGEGTYQLFLGIAQLQNGQFGDEGHAFAAFYHAHKGLHAAQVIGKLAARADFIWQKRTSWSRKQWPSSSSQSCSPFRSEVRITSLLKRASSRDT